MVGSNDLTVVMRKQRLIGFKKTWKCQLSWKTTLESFPSASISASAAK